MPFPLSTCCPGRPPARPFAPPIRLTALLAALLYLARALAAGSAPLTLAEAQHRAVAHSRQLAGHNAAIRTARDMARAAAQLPDPVLKTGIDNLPVSGAERLSLGQDSMTMRRVGVVQEVTRRGPTSANGAASVTRWRPKNRWPERR